MRVKKSQRSNEAIPSLSEDSKILLQLQHVNQLLREADVRTRRLTLEKAKTSPDEYVARLLDAKAKLGKQIKRLSKRQAFKRRHPGGRFAYRLPSEYSANSTQFH